MKSLLLFAALWCQPELDEIDRLQARRTGDAAKDQWIADRQAVLVRKIIGEPVAGQRLDK